MKQDNLLVDRAIVTAIYLNVTRGRPFPPEYGHVDFYRLFSVYRHVYYESGGVSALETTF